MKKISLNGIRNAAWYTEKGEKDFAFKADSYVHIVELEGEYVFEDSYFSLLPNECRTITFKKSREHTSDEITLKAYTIQF